MAEPSNDDFFHKLAGFNRFEGVTDSGNYRPLPDDWLIAIADIVSSTKAIAAGHYKSVNMAGASVISAVLNALDRGDYPFAFGGGDRQSDPVPFARSRRLPGPPGAARHRPAHGRPLHLLRPDGTG